MARAFRLPTESKLPTCQIGAQPARLLGSLAPIFQSFRRSTPSSRMPVTKPQAHEAHQSRGLRTSHRQTPFQGFSFLVHELDSGGQPSEHRSVNTFRRRRFGRARNSNLLFLPDLHSLNLFKGQLVPRSIINPGGRRTGMSGDPLRDLDCAARIHVFGNPRRTEAVTTNSFQDPASLRPFLNQLQDTPTIQASQFNVSRFLPKEGKRGALGFEARPERSSQRSTASLAFECTGTSCSFPRFSWNRNQRVPPRS